MPQLPLLLLPLPVERLHQSVIGTVHGFIHPFGLRDVYVHRETQFGTLFKERIHSRVIRMHAPRRRITVIEKPLPLISKLPDTFCPLIHTSFQFRHCSRSESGFIIAGIIKAAPDIKAIFVRCIDRHNGIKPLASSLGHYNTFLNTYAVHIRYPPFHARIIPGIVMAVHVDDRVHGPLNLCLWNMIDGLRPVVAQQKSCREIFGKSIRRRSGPGPVSPGACPVTSGK